MASYSSLKLLLKPTGKILKRKLIISQKTSYQWFYQWYIRLSFLNNHQTIRIHQSLSILPLCSRIARRIHHWKVDIPQKLVVCGLSNMRSARQNSMKSSSIHNSNSTLLCTPRTSTTTSICVSMLWLYSEKNFLLITSPSKDTLSLKNTSLQIVLTIPILGMLRPTLTLDTHC